MASLPLEDRLAVLRPGRSAEAITHIERTAARAGERSPWPAFVPEELIKALATIGIDEPWRHQAQAASLAHGGTNIVIATGTGSGKSLAYLLPALTALLTGTRDRVLYLAPTKALAADQLRSITNLNLPGVRAAVYDGDTPREEREWVRQHANLVLTNPDMLHHGILPGHERWRLFLKHLRYVVVDESHTYRGVFGSHVAHVLRRLRRLSGVPVFIAASATAGDPAASVSRLVGAPVVAVTEDTAPRGASTFALWEPPMQSDADGVQHRRSTLAETADLLTDAVLRGMRTLAFVPSRRGAEVVAAMAKRALDEAVPGLGASVAAYRGGYLREDRRALERALLDGTLTGLATTNALELGVDLTGLDAVILAGYPGRLASMWQQAGRAGRAGRDSLCVLVAKDDPLDTYLVHHPAALFARPIEATVLDPGNPYVLAPHLCSAAMERPLTGDDLELFGAPQGLVDDLVRAGALRSRPTGYYWTHATRPEVDLRGSGGAPISIVESGSGRLVGTLDAGSAHHALHQGAVYLHQGRSFVVDDLDLADATALVHPDEPDYTTHARDVTDLHVIEIREHRALGPIGLFLGDVDVTHQVVSFQRRRVGSGEVIGTFPLDLPTRQLRTVAVWATLTEESTAEVVDLPGSLHAAEHAAIGLLPLIATCDRWDIGGLSTALHPDTGAPTIFVYDGHPGGAGFAERAYAVVEQWLGATRDAIAACECRTGCPSCVQSPKCGNGNDPLSKPGAVEILDLVLTALR
ncbi:DEAD/DEAH box helicase domain-containing protein [Allocatelliglobosispora scoriae]|uniref:DEAD/DEAH box helicase domain-containing protein n=1 Tax=Allocatelliglobosispora scoriae TaxID=643052 RepID=A0A841BX63_9ACTN|nr:DEAD/DEAH box helicase [Allocatelliglobosispora scoriae]MBB5871320.1 DEAD/DEAH box helicase domain-containing protein [Allocatelliglobosispora scoriae]